MCRHRVLLVLLACTALQLAPLAAAWPANWDPNDPRNLTWEDDGVLARGGSWWRGLTEEDVRYLKREGFGAIANFRAERDDPADVIEAHGLTYLYIPVAHAADMNVTQVRDFIAWAEAQVAQGRPIYAHCTNGMHRAAAFSAAWHMKQHGMTYDEAAKLVQSRRPGTTVRAPAALLQYQAEIMGKPVLTVLLLAPVSRPAHGETMPAIVEVLDASGRAVAGAKVHVWSEKGESNLDFRGTTGPDGRFHFTYRPPAPGIATDHLYARASAPGHLDGADNVEMFYAHGPARPRALAVSEARFVDDGLLVRVSEDNGSPARARVMATGENGQFAFDVTGTGELILPIAPRGEIVTIRAEAWGATGATRALEAPEPGENDSDPGDDGAGPMSPGGIDYADKKPGSRDAPVPGALAGVAVAAGAAVALAGRGRRRRV